MSDRATTTARPGSASARPTVERPGRRPAAQRRRGAVRRFIPPQHGAWAMLLVPYLAAVIVAGFRWPDIPLLVGWLAGYLASYYALQAIKTRRPGRVRAQLLVYAAVAVPMTAIVVIVRPAVLWYAPAYTALLAVNVWFARRRRERDIVNDLASVVQSCLMVFVVATVAQVAPAAVLGTFAAVLAYFVGTVLYVKTMIRERDSTGYRIVSIGYHAVALAAAVWFDVFVAAVFAVLLLRASLLPRRPVSPKRVGLIEIGNCLLLLAAVALA